MKNIVNRIVSIFVILFMLTIMVSVGVMKEQKEQKEQKKQEISTKSTKLFADMGEIERVEYLRGLKVRRIIKMDGKWVWEDDTSYHIDQIEMQKKIETLLELTTIEKVEEVEDTVDYGVEDPTYVIVLMDNNEKTRTVSIGRMTEESNYYIKIDEQKDIYIADRKTREIIISLDSERNLQDRLDAVSSPTIR